MIALAEVFTFLSLARRISSRLWKRVGKRVIAGLATGAAELARNNGLNYNIEEKLFSLISGG